MAHARLGKKVQSSARTVPQASITLDNSNAIVNQVQETSWDLEKTGALSDGTVTWTVKLKKAAVSDQFIKMSGFMTITNTGSAGATIGNIVVNLQTRCPGKKPKSSLTDWGSVSVDIADATHGDDATSALIVANATSETTTTCQGSDYTTSGQPTGAGKFTENSASGTLNFFDVDNDTIFSLVPP